MDDDTIPLEAGIEDRAISLTKGCYVGQEIIIRVLHRGQGRVARRLVGLALEPSAIVPAKGDRIRSGEREVGTVTSAVASPALGRPLALGYVHRDFAGAGNRGLDRVRRRRAAGGGDARFPYTAPRSRAISSASAGGNSSGRSSRLGTQRISWPSSGRGSSVQRAGEEVQLDAALRVGVRDRVDLVADPDVDVELLAHLAPQARGERLARLALAAGKLPHAGEMRAARRAASPGSAPSRSMTAAVTTSVRMPSAGSTTPGRVRARD